jgi:uncharacterized protein (DUF2147 family)
LFFLAKSLKNPPRNSRQKNAIFSNKKLNFVLIIHPKNHIIMFKKIALGLALSFSALASAQIEGRWKTIDDESGREKAVIEISKRSDGKYYGKIVQMLIKPENDLCIACPDDRKNKAIVGLEIIRGLSKDDDEFNGGTILDPKKGKIYKCSITPEGADQLKVRGYIGFSLLGRNQIWKRYK